MKNTVLALVTLFYCLAACQVPAAAKPQAIAGHSAVTTIAMGGGTVSAVPRMNPTYGCHLDLPISYLEPQEPQVKTAQAPEPTSSVFEGADCESDMHFVLQHGDEFSTR